MPDREQAEMRKLLARIGIEDSYTRIQTDISPRFCTAVSQTVETIAPERYENASSLNKHSERSLAAQPISSPVTEHGSTTPGFYPILSSGPGIIEKAE